MKLIKFFAVVLLVSGSSFFLYQCKEKEDDPGSGIQVTGFDPVSGSAGDLVHISGRNFSIVASNNKVNFNGTPATIIDANTTSITVLIPAGATTGKIAVTANGTTVFSHDDFRVLQSTPGITAFTPSSGIAGSAVVINGNGFSPSASDNVVTFNGVAAIVTSSTAQSINTTVPDGATTGKITVTVTISGTSATYTSTTDFLVPAPTVSGFTPAYGLPGTSIVITGSNFNSGSPSNNIVTINGTAAPVTAATSTQLTVTVPLATTGKIAVSVGGQSATSISNYEVLKDIPKDGLVGFYPFKGDVTDASGNSLNATANGEPMLSTDRFGIDNQAYTLDGINDYITMGDPAKLQISNTMTVAGWFKVHESAPANMRAMIVKIFFDPAKGFNPESGFYISQNQNSADFHLYSYLADGSDFAINEGVANSAVDSWIFIAFVTDGTSWKFYKDTTVSSGIASVGNANPDATLGDFVIGSYAGGFFFDGSVDDITIYNRALSSDEIQQLYTQTVTKY